jgi:hypothetical protein
MHVDDRRWWLEGETWGGRQSWAASAVQSICLVVLKGLQKGLLLLLLLLLLRDQRGVLVGL